MNWLDSVSVNLLSKDLDGLWARQQAISDNLANVETPGYKSKTVSFEDQLKAQLSANTGSVSDTVQGINAVQPVASVSNDQSLRADGNNVDVDKENIELARTQLNYMYSLQGLSDQFSRLRIAITGRNS